MALCGDEANSVCHEEPEKEQHQTGAKEQGTQDRSVESGHREELAEVFWSPSINALGIWEVRLSPKKQKETKQNLRAGLAGRQARA